MNWSKRWFSLGIVISLGCLLGLMFFSTWDKPPTPLEKVEWSTEAQWIGSDEPSYNVYARHNFYLSSASAATGWLRISADNNFILYLNGKEIGRQDTQNSSSLPIASRNTLPNQNINDSRAYEVKTKILNLAYPENWRLTYYVNLTPYLITGQNVLAVDVIKARDNPRVVIEGAIYPTKESPPIQLTTGASLWRVSTLTETRQGLFWWDPDFSDLNWSEAKLLGRVKESTYSRLSPNVFSLPIEANWITSEENSLGEIRLEGSWQVPKEHKHAYIRFSGDGEYSVLINNHFVGHFLPKENKRKLLNVYEVSNLLSSGKNTITVRLSRPLTPSNSLEQGLLKFLLDGWVESNANHNIVAPIQSDTSWQSAIVIGKANPHLFPSIFYGDAYWYDYPSYFWHSLTWQSITTIIIAIYVWFLGRFWLLRTNSWWDSFCSGAILVLPATLFLVGITLLKHRFAESPPAIIFALPFTNPIILLCLVAVVMATLLWSRKQSLGMWSSWGIWLLVSLTVCITIGAIAGVKGLVISLVFCALVALMLLWQQLSNLNFSRIINYFQGRRKWLLFAGVLVIGFITSSYDLSFTPRDSDENTSFNAIAGILDTGAPIMPSGIWYTRSPIFHYLIALWLRIFGYSTSNARFISVIFGIATLVIVFLLARKISGRFWLALLITFILAIDPWYLMNARNLRFYQMFAFTTTLSFWSFYKGVIYREGRVYQYIFIIAITLSLLIQEGIAPTLVPCFGFGLLYFYRPFSLRSDWKLVLASFIGFCLYIYNLVFFILKCLTPSVGISGTSIPVGIHFAQVTGYILSFLASSSRVNTIYSLFFILGFLYFLKHKNKPLLFLFSSIFIQLITITLLVFTLAPRYTYAIYPLFLILSIYSLFTILKTIARKADNILSNNIIPIRTIALTSAFVMLMANIEVGRVLASYQDKLSRDNPTIFSYIKENIQPGDIVIAGNPPGAGNVLGYLDYYLPPRDFLFFDGLYYNDGKLVDRWAGGVLISNLDQLINVMENHNRIWIQLDNKFSSQDPKLLERYNYIRSLGKPVFETYGVKLRLWEAADGVFPRIPNQGQDVGNY